ncbi:MAG TPA: hypothetical protein VIT92_05215 [Burkholderiaceae bacterium]
MVKPISAVERAVLTARTADSGATDFSFGGMLTQAKAEAAPPVATASASPTSLALNRTPPLLSEKLMLPTRANVEMLADRAGAALKQAFADAGIAEQPPVTFNIDHFGRLYAEGERGDLAEIEQMVADNPALKRQLHNLNGLASQTAALEQTMQYQDAYRNAHSPAEIAAVNARFSALLNGAQHFPAMSLAFDGKVQVLADGNPFQTA